MVKRVKRKEVLRMEIWHNGERKFDEKIQIYDTITLYPKMDVEVRGVKLQYEFPVTIKIFPVNKL